MKTQKYRIIPALFFLAIGFGCNNDKNDSEGPVYRGEKGVVIRGNNEDDRHQIDGSTDSLYVDSLQNPEKSTTPAHEMGNTLHK